MSEFQVMDREIAPKGKCYVICTSYDGADFAEKLADLCDTAAACGANRFYFACRDQSVSLDEQAFSAGAYAFSFYSNFDMLRKTLSKESAAVRTPLHLKALRAGFVPLYLSLYNESFFDVPNSLTADAESISAILADEKRDAGFLMFGGEPVGFYELDYRGEQPEIASVGIRSAYRGNGYGTTLLTLLETRLASEGHACAELLVADANKRAYKLYRSLRYAFSKRIGRWYETRV